jgi:hypothetical protein
MTRFVIIKKNLLLAEEDINRSLKLNWIINVAVWQKCQVIAKDLTKFNRCQR